MVSTSDPEDTTRLVKQVMQSMAEMAGGQAPAIKSMEVRSDITLVTEPDGLIPHGYTLTRNFTMDMDGTPAPLVQADQTEAVYSYE